VTEAQKDTFRKALKDARESFVEARAKKFALTRELSEVTDEVARLRRTITALAATCSEEPGIDKLGITDACMEVMIEAPVDYTTADVVRELEFMGFDIESQKNAPASVHAVLSRLAKAGKITKLETPDSNIVQWRGPGYVTGDGVITDEDIPF